MLLVSRWIRGFGENLTIEGIDLVSLFPGTRISIGKEVILGIAQTSKECHNRCAIYRQAGNCVMPCEGVFARVNRSEVVRSDDPIKVEV